MVHLLKNQPPLPSKVVERIREGSFVDFAFFPVFDDGPGEAGDRKLSSSEASESSSGGFGKRKNPKEVPDLAGWSTSFTLFQVAWASSKPEMWVPLAAYREVIFKLAKRHQWAQVAWYDRRFRQEAADKDDVKWEEENLSLLLPPQMEQTWLNLHWVPKLHLPSPLLKRKQAPLLLCSSFLSGGATSPRPLPWLCLHLWHGVDHVRAFSDPVQQARRKKIDSRHNWHSTLLSHC